MDAKIRAKFYKVENIEPADATFFECLHRLWNHPNRVGYEDIPGGVRVRLERFQDDVAIVGAGFVDGEFVRQQTENIPPIAVQGQPLLGNSDPLGHRCAFRYHAATSCLLLEGRQNGVTPSRMDGLMKVRLRPHKGFHVYPVLTEAALDRLRNGTPRRVAFRVASPADMRAVEGMPWRLEENLARMANNFDGLSVEIQVGFPRGVGADRSLNMNAINDAIRWATGNRDHVEKFEVKVS